MAKAKRSIPAQIEKDYLTKSKEQFKVELKERLEFGAEMLARNVTDAAEIAKLSTDYSYWSDYNAELLKQSFNNPINSYFKEYTYTGIMVNTIGGGYSQPSINEIVQERKAKINKYYDRLKKIYEKVNLMEVLPGLVLDNINHEATDDNSIEILVNLFQRFHKVAQTLRQRHSNRETLIITDEYDVQDLLRALLRINFNDVREEDYVPHNAGSNSRVDFVLKNEKIIIEVKITSATLKDKEIGSQLLIDIGRYTSHPDCSMLAIFIYDKGDFIVNKVGLKKDLESKSTNALIIKVFIEPQ